MTKGGPNQSHWKLLEGMCVCESSNSETCSSSATSPIHDSGADSVDVQAADSALRQILEPFPLNEENSIVSPNLQHETLPDVADNNSEEQTLSVLYSVTISASESDDANFLLTPVSKTLSSVEECNDTSVLDESSQEHLSNSSDIKQDEEHFNISLQVSTEPVFNNDEQSQEPTQMGGEPHGPSMMVLPGEGVTVKSMLPLSPKETEAFDEKKSLEALDSLVMESGHEVLSQDLQNVDTTPFVKEELKERIKLRRQKKGLPNLEVGEESPKPDILTAEEEEKRRIRRERNRIAAAKCRRKKKEKASEKRKITEMIREQNLALLDELSQLMDEKARLQAMWTNHMKECKRRDMLELQLPELTSVMIRTTPELDLSDADSMGDEPLVINEDSSDSSSVDLTSDVGDQMIDSSFLDAMTEAPGPSTTTCNIQEAVTLLNSVDGDCITSTGNLQFEFLPSF